MSDINVDLVSFKIYYFWTILKLIEQTFFLYIFFSVHGSLKKMIRRMKVIIKHLKLPSCLPFYLFIFFMTKIMANFERFNYVFNIKRSFFKRIIRSRFNDFKIKKRIKLFYFMDLKKIEFH